MRCDYYASGRCRSCSELWSPYSDQLRRKELHCRSILGGIGSPSSVEWLPAVPSAPSRFRNKAKMVVSGSARAPLLGILDAEQRGVDLTGCPLYPDALTASFPPITEFITCAGLPPYDVRGRRGELKYVLVTWASHSDRLMVRLVLRTESLLPRIREHLPELPAALPQIAVASVNLQPEHNAIVEGENEIVLTEGTMLEMELNGRIFYLPPRAFFQTNTEVAAQLYRQAQLWGEELGPRRVLDLFCGVGTFALHLADGERSILGVESIRDAVDGACRSAERQRTSSWNTHPEFLCLDASQIEAGRLLAERCDDLARAMVIVNPPRRGIGEKLALGLNGSGARWVVYSSCQVESLARDLRSLPRFTLRRARLLDMFPHTNHYEVIALLERNS